MAVSPSPSTQDVQLPSPSQRRIRTTRVGRAAAVVDPRPPNDLLTCHMSTRKLLTMEGDQILVRLWLARAPGFEAARRC